MADARCMGLGIREPGNLEVLNMNFYRRRFRET